MVGTEFCDALILLQASFNTKAAAPACEGSCPTWYLSSRGLQSFWLSKNCSPLFSLARDSEKSSQSSRTLTSQCAGRAFLPLLRKIKWFITQNPWLVQPTVVVGWFSCGELAPSSSSMPSLGNIQFSCASSGL